ncbi:MAG: sugar phosphate isomerase/epimerase [Planctomycetota bacterium]|jgi:D-psicose/D-tagatose/L-ribulose 3-epimerase|nr:sugar phosphate isomerase/epimerase [Planctomycetota bacterium]
MNKLGLNLWNWIERYDDSAVALFPKVKKLGYDIVEFGLDDLDFDPALAGGAARDNGLEITLCAVTRKGRDISNEDPDLREATKKYLTRCIEFAGVMGAKSIGGGMYSGGGRARILDANQRKAEWDLAVIGLRSLAPVARDNGVTMCIEPLNRYKTDMVNQAWQARKMAEDIGENCFKILFDTYQASIEEKSIPAAIRQAGEYIRHFHASENDRGCPGTGHVDWKGSFAALREIGYAGPVVVESFCVSPRDNVWRATEASPDTLAEKAVAFLRESLH